MARHVFVHIGDAHFGPGERNADRYDALDQIILHGATLAAHRELAAWLWPGDIGHARLSIADLNALDEKLLAMASVAPVVICYGNHDQPGDLDGFARLKSKFPIYVISRPQVLRLDMATHASAAIFVLPYPHRAGLVSAGADHASLADEARSALDPIFIAAAADLKYAERAGAYCLAIGHVNVGGSVASTGQPQIGQEIELDPALLARLEAASYVGLNHIHKHQTIHGAVYAGSICRLDFGEREPKGFIEAEFRNDEGFVARDWRFVPLDVPQQFDVEGELTRYGFEVTTVNGIEPSGIAWTGADVRVRYRYLKADAGVVNLEAIKAQFAGCRSLKLEGLPQLTHEMRAPEIAAAVTLEEKVAKYCELHRIVATAAFREKLAALLATEPDRLLAYLQSGLAIVGTTPEESAVA